MLVEKARQEMALLSIARMNSGEGLQEVCLTVIVVLCCSAVLSSHFNLLCITEVVQRNLHVVFTMNPSGGEWKNRSTTSPALFNRCVVDWFGTWGPKAMSEVGKEFTISVDMGDAESVGGSWGIGAGQELMARVEEAFEGASQGGFHQAVVAALVELHTITKNVSEEEASSASSMSRTFLSPR